MPAQVFSCEICEIFKNTYFEEHLRTTVSPSTPLCTVLICKPEPNWNIFFRLRRSKNNFIGCINDTFCRTITLFSSLLSWRFAKFFKFTCAVRGSHVYLKFWIPEKGLLLNCFHESGNVFDPFAIKACERNSEKRVGHLPQGISRVTKFIIERGAIVDVELTSDHYRRSPLVQGGLEIKCNVTIKGALSGLR